MASENQIAANRCNSKKSTGPITPAGKAVAARNALRYGIYARTAVPGESQDEFDDLCEDLTAQWEPETPTERHQLEQMASAYFSQCRIGLARRQLFATCASVLDNLDSLDRLDRQHDRLQHKYDRALRVLRSLQKDRKRQEELKLEPKADDDDDEPEEQICRGLAWVDKDNNVDLKVPPSVKGKDGKWRDLPPEEWGELDPEWKIRSYPPQYKD